MARPLRKVGRDGSLYTRRSDIELEIDELEKLTDEEIGTKMFRGLGSKHI